MQLQKILKHLWLNVRKRPKTHYDKLVYLLVYINPSQSLIPCKRCRTHRSITKSPLNSDTLLLVTPWKVRNSRISRSQMLFRIGVLKIFIANFTGKRPCWSLLWIKLQVIRPTTLLTRGSNANVFLWNWRNI